MHNIEEIYKQACASEIDEAIIPDLISLLRNPTTTNNDKMTLVGILAEHGDVKYASAIEPCLEEENELLVCRTLNVLTQWDDDGRREASLMRFLRGMPWDYDNYVRDCAISSAGDWLRRNSSPEVLAALMRFFSDENADEYDRVWAYCAIGRAMGLSWNQVPDMAQEIGLNVVDPNVIEQAKERLGSNNLD